MKKIWWQSSTNVNDFPIYKETIESHAMKYLGAYCSLEVHGVPFGTTNIDYLAFGTLNEHEIIHNMLRLRDEGNFDAVALGCFHDPAINAIREIIDIPVMGMAEAACMWAKVYSRRPAVVFSNANAADKTIVHVLDDYDMNDMMLPPRYFELEVEMLVDAFENPQPAIDAFLNAAKVAVKDGADMIIPGCGILNLVMAENGMNRVPGTDVPIMDVTAVLMKTTEAAIALHDIGGMNVSRRDYYRMPPASLVDTVRNIYFPQD